MNWNLLIVNIILFNIPSVIGQNPVEVKRSRRPNRIDHLFCRQKNSGFGIRSSAVLNYSGELCKTYCRVINRANRTANFVEYVSPNNIRCGPFGARCIEGVCTPSGSAGSSSGAISETASNSRRGINKNRIDAKRRVRPGRRGSPSPQKTTSLSTIEMTNLDETETATTDVVTNETEDTDIKAKIIFPNE